MHADIAFGWSRPEPAQVFRIESINDKSSIF